MSELKRELMSMGMSPREADDEIGSLRECMQDCIESGDFFAAEDLMIENGIDLDFMLDLL